MKKITVLLAEDHVVVREGFRKMLELEDDLEVVGEAQDGRRAVLNVIENVRRAVYFSSPNIFHKDVQPYLDGSNALKYWHTTNRKYLYANLE